MMRPSNEIDTIWLAREAIDFRIDVSVRNIDTQKGLTRVIRKSW